MMENIDHDKYGNKIAEHIARYCAMWFYYKVLKKELVAAQAQILRCLLVSKKLKDGTSLLGIQKATKD